MKKAKTPNALPPTVLSLSKELGISLTLQGARQVNSVTMLGPIGRPGRPYVKDGHMYPCYYVDVNAQKVDGNGTYYRSRTIRTAKRMHQIHRAVTRKLAVFLFENKAA